jgi:selenocysteine lyase/cysteine desulfurase
VVAGADADALAADDVRDVVRVRVVARERHERAAPVGLGRPEDREARDVAQALERVGGDVALVRAHRVAATTRASFAVHNTTDDVDRLVEALGEVERIFA